MENVTIKRELANNLVNYMANQGTGVVPFNRVLTMCQQLENALAVKDSPENEAAEKNTKPGAKK